MALLRQATESDLASVEALLRASGLPTAGVAVHLPHFVVAGGVSGIVGVAASNSTDAMRSFARSLSSNTRVAPG